MYKEVLYYRKLADKLAKQVQNRIRTKWPYENAGVKEGIKFNDYLADSMLHCNEKCNM
jgi:hypothetical protein